MSDRCFGKEVINVCTLFSIYLCTILLKALYGHSLEFRWPPLRWPGVRWPPLRWPGVRWPPLAIEGVANEPLAIEGEVIEPFPAYKVNK